MAEAVAPDAHFLLTLDDSDTSSVLELVRSDSTGMYIRDNGTWIEINPDANNSRVWDRQFLDVTPDIVGAYDSAQQLGTATVDQLSSFVIPDEVQ